MNRRTIAYLIVGVVVLMVIIAIIGSIQSPLPVATMVQANHAIKQYESLLSDIKQTAGEFNQGLKKHPELFQALGYDTQWPKQISSLTQRAQSVNTTRQSLDAMLQENDGEKHRQVVQTIRDLSQSTATLKSQAQSLKKQCKEVLNFKASLAKSLDQMQTQHAAIQARDLSTVKAAVQKAGVNWPGKKADLDQRLVVLQEAVDQASRAWQSTQPARQAVENGEVTDQHVAAAYQAHRQMAAAGETIDAGMKTIPELAEQLNWSWDKLLVDMEIREGQVVEFFQEYETAKTYALAEQGQKAKQQTQRERKSVSKAVYESMKKNLGMVVEHKDAGQYDHEAKRSVQPPGYAYMASPQQGRNRYGYWDHRPGGGSFWVFYGQYALMRDLFWGSGYRPSAMDYGHYDQSRRAGRTYYGRDDRGQPLYGSRGGVTQTKYKNSKYVRTGGFRSSQYIRSGGSYRGSRYESSSYRSSSRSGSRFGGGK